MFLKNTLVVIFARKNSRFALAAIQLHLFYFFSCYISVVSSLNNGLYAFIL